MARWKRYSKRVRVRTALPRDRAAALTMLGCFAAGEVDVRNFLKIMTMTNAPSLWYRYIRMRRAAVDRTQVGGRP